MTRLTTGACEALGSVEEALARAGDFPGYPDLADPAVFETLAPATDPLPVPVRRRLVRIATEDGDGWDVPARLDLVLNRPDLDMFDLHVILDDACDHLSAVRKTLAHPNAEDDLLFAAAFLAFNFPAASQGPLWEAIAGRSLLGAALAVVGCSRRVTRSRGWGDLVEVAARALADAGPAAVAAAAKLDVELDLRVPLTELVHAAVAVAAAAEKA